MTDWREWWCESVLNYSFSSGSRRQKNSFSAFSIFVFIHNAVRFIIFLRKTFFFVVNIFLINNNRRWKFHIDTNWVVVSSAVIKIHKQKYFILSCFEFWIIFSFSLILWKSFIRVSLENHHHLYNHKASQEFEELKDVKKCYLIKRNSSDHPSLLLLFHPN